MRRSRFTEEQIHSILREIEAGASIVELCKRLGVSKPTIYRWKRQYKGMIVSKLQSLRSLEEENSRLKRLVAEQALENQLLRDLLLANGVDRFN